MSDLQVISMSFLARQIAQNSAKDELIGELHTKLQASTVALAEVKHQMHAERVDFDVKLKEMQKTVANEVTSNARRIGKCFFNKKLYWSQFCVMKCAVQ